MEIDSSSGLVTSFVNNLDFSTPSEEGFKSLLSDAKKKPVKEKFTKIADHVYKVDATLDNPKDILNDSIQKDSSVRDIKDVEEKTPTNNDPITQEDKKQVDERLGFVFQMQLINPKSFTDSLPKSMQSFIKEIVTIIKQYHQDLQTHSFKFKFSDLNIQVSMVTIEDVINIKIFSAQSDLKSDLYKDENKQLLFQILQKEFGEDGVQLDFVDSEQALDFGGQDNQDQSQDSDEDDKEDNND